jgi:hypothetical protein
VSNSTPNSVSDCLISANISSTPTRRNVSSATGSPSFSTSGASATTAVAISAMYAPP